MKKFLLFAAMALSVFLLSACTSAQGLTQGFVELPGDVKSGITAAVLVAVSFLIVRLVTIWKALEFLVPYRIPIAMAISVELIRVIQVATPDAYGTIVILALQLILAVLALFKFFEILGAQGVSGFK